MAEKLAELNKGITSEDMTLLYNGVPPTNGATVSLTDDLTKYKLLRGVLYNSDGAYRSQVATAEISTNLFKNGRFNNMAVVLNLAAMWYYNGVLFVSASVGYKSDTSVDISWSLNGWSFGRIELYGIK